MHTANDQKLDSEGPENLGSSSDVHLAWLIEAEKGLEDVLAGRTSDARASILAIQARRSASHIRNAPRTESPNL
jgi:hypothetical protein